MNKKSLLQHRWLVRIVLILWVFSSFLALFLFSSIDRIVHHDLYAYGLQFSIAWASAYWGLVLAIYVCMLVPAALSIGVLAYDFVKTMNSAPAGKKRNGRQVLEKSMLVTCSRCKRRFNRALVMLDFTQKPPKRVSVCPYCNSVLKSTEDSDSETIHITELEKVTPTTT